MKLKHRLINALILGFLVISVIDTWPFEGKIHSKLKGATNPATTVLGIWQGPWKLFAPDADKENHQIEARIKNPTTGEVEIWTSPDWTTHNCFQKFTSSREMKYYDNIRYQYNMMQWPAFARHLARTTGNPTAEIEFSTVSDNILLPENPPAPTQRKVFYTFYQ